MGFGSRSFKLFRQNLNETPLFPQIEGEEEVVFGAPPRSINTFKTTTALSNKILGCGMGRRDLFYGFLGNLDTYDLTWELPGCVLHTLL